MKVNLQGLTLSTCISAICLKMKFFFYPRVLNLFQRPKSIFNPKRKDAAIEIYLSRLEWEIFSLDKNFKYSNLTKEERQAIYFLRDDTSIIIKEADKGSGIVVWDKEEYLAETRTQLKDKDVYQELKGNIAGSGGAEGSEALRLDLSFPPPPPPVVNLHHLNNIKLEKIQMRHFQ